MDNGDKVAVPGELSIKPVEVKKVDPPAKKLPKMRLKGRPSELGADTRTIGQPPTGPIKSEAGEESIGDEAETIIISRPSVAPVLQKDAEDVDAEGDAQTILIGRPLKSKPVAMRIKPPGAEPTQTKTHMSVSTKPAAIKVNPASAPSDQTQTQTHVPIRSKPVAIRVAPPKVNQHEEQSFTENETNQFTSHSEMKDDDSDEHLVESTTGLEEDKKFGKKLIIELMILGCIPVALLVGGYFGYGAYQDYQEEQAAELRRKEEAALQSQKLNLEVRDIEDALTRAKACFKNAEYDGALAALQKLEELDPDNSEGKRLKTRVVAKQQEIKIMPVRSKATSLFERVAEMDDSQGFGARKKRITSIYSSTEALFNNGHYGDVLPNYQEVIKISEELIVLDKVRNELKPLFVKAQASQKSAEDADAERDASAVWYTALLQYESAEEKYAEGTFHEVQEILESCNVLFKTAKYDAEGYRFANSEKREFDRMAAAIKQSYLEQFGDESWQKAKSAADYGKRLMEGKEWDDSVKNYKVAQEHLVKAIATAATTAEFVRAKTRSIKLFQTVLEEVELMRATASATKSDIDTNSGRYAVATAKEKEELKRIAKGACEGGLEKLEKVTTTYLEEQHLARLKTLKASLQLISEGIKYGPPLPEKYTIPEPAMVFCRVEGGSFQMGMLESEGDERPVRKVIIESPFWLGMYEVTQKQYTALIKDNPSGYIGENRPVERISWLQAMDYCKKLTEMHRKAGTLPEGYEFRLPTEAEWEYAALGGKLSHGYRYAGGNSLDAVAWYSKNSKGQTHSVGRKAPNELGLYDMSGNVWEWCYDWYNKYTGKIVSNPIGPLKGGSRVNRGGSCKYSAVSCRSRNRNHTAKHPYLPGSIHKDLGFRICLGPIIVIKEEKEEW